MEFTPPSHEGVLLLAGAMRPGLMFTDYLLCTHDALWDLHEHSGVSPLAGAPSGHRALPKHVAPKPLAPTLPLAAPGHTSSSLPRHQTL